MYLIVALNANGKPKSWKAPATDVFNWPRLIQLSWRLYDENRQMLDAQDHLIKPEGFTIAENAFHKIEQAQAEAEGRPLKEVLTEFMEVLDKAEHLVCHNLNFDTAVLTAEMLRKSLEYSKLSNAEAYSLMAESTHFCKLRGKGGRYKWPTLTELFARCFKKRYADAGNSKFDANAISLCFFALLEARAIELF